MRSEDEAGDLSRALEEYLTEREAGLDPDAFLSRYPELADELRPCLTALELIGAAGAGDDAAVADVAQRSIGDFRLVREIGRGGMGVVYEAEQVSLDRRVALKVLPFAAVLDERHLRRFRNEARAAAHLHHTHIVPVYSVGVERGVHYYAMQFIDGLAVDDLVGELRWSTGRPAGPRRTPTSSSAAVQAITGGSDTGSGEYCRSIARLGVQAARALDHAHEQGIVHRDVKPANLLVDATGHLWITDFGLASFRDRPGPTMTGDLVGTVRYMSPEQALAGRAVVDHRTDVYSLGVTLYELITLEQAFPGDDAHRIIQDIAFRDPVPARRHNPAVPAELETILGKAMSKSPDDRYATAAALAEDLERFLEDRPIRAKRPGLVKRAAKWSLRHRAVVRAGLVVLLLAVVGLAITTAIVARERADAIEARDEALLARDEATSAREEATAAREKMERHFERSVEAIEGMLAELGGERLAYVPQMEPVRRELLRKAVELYQGLMADRGDDHDLRFWAANARWRLAGVYTLLRDSEGAQAEYAGAFSDFLALAKEFDCQKCRLRGAMALTGLAGERNRLGRLPEGEAALRRVLEILDEVPDDAPEADVVREQRAEVFHGLGVVLSATGRLIEGAAAFRRSLKIREAFLAESPSAYREERTQAVAAARASLGQHHRTARRAREAEEELRRAVVLLDDLGDEAKLAPGTRQQLGRHLRAWGSNLLDLGRYEEAERVIVRAEAVARGLAREHPSTLEYRADLAGALNAFGNLRAQLHGDLDEAGMMATEEAVRIFRDLRRMFPGYPRDAFSLGMSLHNLSKRRVDTDPPAALALAEEAVAHLRVAAAARPRHPETRRHLGYALHDRANAIRQLGPAERALEAYGDLLAELNAFLREFEGDPAVRMDLCRAGFLRGQILCALGKADEGREAYVRAVELGRVLVEEEPTPDRRKELAWALELLGGWYRADGLYDEAERCYRESLAERQAMVREAGAACENARLPPVSLNHLGVLASLRGRFVDAVDLHRAAARILEDLAKRFPESRLSVLSYLDTLRALGEAQTGAGQHEDARETLEKAESEIRAASPETDTFVAIYLVDVLERKGQLAVASGRPEEAVAAYRAQVELAGSIVTRHPQALAPVEKQARARVLLGQALWSTRELEAAAAEFDEAARLLERIIEKGRRYWSTRFSLLGVLAERGRLHAVLKRDFRPILDRMLELMRGLEGEITPFSPIAATAIVNGRSAAYMAWHLQDVDRAVEALRWTLALEEPRASGEPAMTLLARDAYLLDGCLISQGRAVEALELSERILKRDPTRALTMHAVAGGLLVHPDPARRQPERALALAEAVVRTCETMLEKNPEDPDAKLLAPNMWNTLGLARLRTGDHAGAIEAALRQEKIGSQIPVADWLVLALAHALRGEANDAEEARRWFARAKAWREGQQESFPGLDKLYDEVEVMVEGE